MVDLALILYSGIGTACVAVAIVLWVNRDVWVPFIGRIVSGISGGWSASIRRAREQKAYREWLSANNMSSVQFARFPRQGAVSVSDTNTDTSIKPIDTADLAFRLTEDQFIEIGALMRNKNGKALYSGKKLYVLAGGNYNDFVAKIRRLRGGDADMPEEPTVNTPIAGRPTKASYYQDDPELEYQAP